jgi:hypothetical protein
MNAKHFLSAAAALALLTSTGASFAQSDTKERAPGQQMQDPTAKPKVEGPGASGFAPGRQERSPDSKGASDLAPGQGGASSKGKSDDTTGAKKEGTK